MSSKHNNSRIKYVSGMNLSSKLVFSRMKVGGFVAVAGFL
jgi:hypothetical protein